MKNKYLIVLIAASLIISCNNNSGSSSKNETQKTVLKLNWVFTGSFAPEALAARDFAKKNNLELKIEQGGQGKDPLKLVGNNEFGAAAADEIMRANDKGADFVIIGVINENSPACFISQSKDSIKSPTDFQGKTVGILPFGSTGIVYKILLKKTGLDASKIKELTVYPDLKVFLIGKSHQVQPAFIYDETVSLDIENIKYNVIEPKNYGVVFKGPCYFTTRATIEKNTKLVQAFVSTMAEGMNEAIKEPAKAISALKWLSSDINSDRELKVWSRGLEYYKGFNGQPLTTDIASWKEMAEELKSFNEIKNEPDLNKLLNLSFINSYYKK